MEWEYSPKSEAQCHGLAGSSLQLNRTSQGRSSYPILPLRRSANQKGVALPRGAGRIRVFYGINPKVSAGELCLQSSASGRQAALKCLRGLVML